MDLRGLLQDPQFRLGLGLLSAAGPRPAAQSGFGQRLGDAMGSYDAWDAQQKKMKMLEEEEKRRVEADKYLAQLRQAQAEKLMRLAGQGLDEDSPSDVKSARTLMTEWNKVYPDNQITYPEALDISKRGPPSFEGMPLRRTKDKSWELAVDDSAFANLAKILAYQKALGTGTGRAETTLVSGTGPDNKPAFSSEAAQLGLVAPRASVQQQPATAAQQPTTADQLPDFMRLPEPLRNAMFGVHIPDGQGAAPAAPATGLRPIQASEPTLAAERERLVGAAKKETTLENQATDYARLAPVIEKIDAEDLITKATGSAVGNVRDIALRSVGLTSSGAAANAQLQPLVGRILNTVPRFEGPQSDKDAQEYRSQAGDLGNPNKTAEEKKAALNSIKWLVGKYKYKHGEKRAMKNGGTAQWDTTVGKWVQVD